MRIVDLLKKQSIDLNVSVADKAAAIDHLVDLMAAGGNLNDKELYKQRVLAREQEGSTGIGEGIAIPHAKTEAVNEPGLASMMRPLTLSTSLNGDGFMAVVSMPSIFACSGSITISLPEWPSASSPSFSWS